MEQLNLFNPRKYKISADDIVIGMFYFMPEDSYIGTAKEFGSALKSIEGKYPILKEFRDIIELHNYWEEGLRQLFARLTRLDLIRGLKRGYEIKRDVVQGLEKAVFMYNEGHTDQLKEAASEVLTLIR